MSIARDRQNSNTFPHKPTPLRPRAIAPGAIGGAIVGGIVAHSAALAVGAADAFLISHHVYLHVGAFLCWESWSAHAVCDAEVGIVGDSFWLSAYWQAAAKMIARFGSPRPELVLVEIIRHHDPIQARAGFAGPHGDRVLAWGQFPEQPVA